MIDFDAFTWGSPLKRYRVERTDDAAKLQKLSENATQNESETELYSSTLNKKDKN